MRTILTLTQHAHVVVYEDIRHHDGKQHYGVSAAWPENSLTPVRRHQARAPVGQHPGSDRPCAR